MNELREKLNELRNANALMAFESIGKALALAAYKEKNRGD